MNKIFFTSDHHFNHHKIIEYCNRSFNNINDMNSYMILHWNEKIDNDDTVYHLGDFCFGNFYIVKNIFEQLNGKKILILGNHDRHSVSFYVNIGFEEVYKKEHIAEINNYKLLLSHRPQILDKDYYINIHGHLHNKFDYAFDSNNKTFNVSVDIHDYYPIEFSDMLEIIK